MCAVCLDYFVEQINHMTGHIERSLEFQYAVRNAQFLYFLTDVSDWLRNAAGYLQFFTTSAVHRFLISSGVVILNT
jgi:hypothetical protein